MPVREPEGPPEAILRRIVLNQRLPPGGAVDEERDIADTSSGKAEEQCRSRLAEIHQETKQASKENDSRTKQELEAAHTELDKEFARSETNRERLSQDNVEDKDQIEEKLRREQAARKQQIAQFSSATETSIHTSEVERQQMT